MKPQARIQAVIDILENIETSKVPMDSVVGDYMRYRRYIGSKDRAAISENVYAIKRSHARLGWHLKQIDRPDTARSRMLTYLALEKEYSPKQIGNLFDGSKYAPAPLTPDEESLIKALEDRSLDADDMPDTVKLECPPLYTESLQTYFGDFFVDEMRAFIPGATLDLRVNTFLATREKVRDYLEAAGVETDPTPYSPWGLRARGKAYLAKTKAFAKGWVEIQDEGSQLIASICEAKPGMQVLDYCAGAGGKTLALAAAMERKGRIVAMDTSERRLEKGRQRYKKAQLTDIIEVRPLSEKRHAKWLRRQKGTFDIVLCDIPCTGTGTWRRNPDMRWKTYGPPLEELMKIQADILDRITHAVKPGGRLVYATCSLLPEENEQQIEKFLERYPDFEILPLAESLGIGTPFMRLTPLQHNTDGFFGAILVKKHTPEQKT